MNDIDHRILARVGCWFFFLLMLAIPVGVIYILVHFITKAW